MMKLPVFAATLLIIAAHEVLINFPSKMGFLFFEFLIGAAFIVAVWLQD
jgi:hypothetical protein